MGVSREASFEASAGLLGVSESGGRYFGADRLRCGFSPRFFFADLSWANRSSKAVLRRLLEALAKGCRMVLHTYLGAVPNWVLVTLNLARKGCGGC